MQARTLFMNLTTILPGIPIAALIYLQDIIAINESIGIDLGLTDRGIELLGTLEVMFLFYWVPGSILFHLRANLPDSPPPEEGLLVGPGSPGFAAIASRLHAPQQPAWLPFQYRRIPHWYSHHPTSSSPHKITTRSMVNLVFLNHISILLTYAFLLTLIPPPFTHTAATFPSLTKIGADVTFAVLLGDLLTYFLHRKFHTSPVIYKEIHSMHHKYRESNALAAHYAHPLEVILMNWMCIWVPIAGMGWFGRYAGMGSVSTIGMNSWWACFGFPWVTQGVHVVEWFILWSGVLFWSVLVHGGVEPVWIGNIAAKPKNRPFVTRLTNMFAGCRGVQGKFAPRWNLLKRHDLHHEVGGGAGRVQTTAELKGRPQRWGNFAAFWWVDAIFGTEIELSPPGKPYVADQK